jgi:[ribosomal protein S18]-alanine N-acetyltransferase
MPLRAEVRLRRFVESDLPQVLEIEQASFPLPWKAEFFLKELHNPNGWSWVAEKEGTIVGYLCGWFVVDEGEILRVAVHPSYRRCGFGKILLEEAMVIAGQRGVSTLHLEVRVSNRAAITLYQLRGFHEVGRRRRYYENGEDALLMRWEGGDVGEEK